MRSIKERLQEINANIIVGVGGDSGSGKTTFSQGIKNILGKDMVSGFSMDDYHTEDREERKKTGHLPLDPKYNDLDLLSEHLASLREGNEIIKPVYNHTTGSFDPQVLFKPTPIIIIEGLHPFATEDIRNKMDFKIFVDPVRDVKWKWKMQRDTEKRGHGKEEAFQEMLRREPFFKLYIDVQKIYSEVIIHIEPSRYQDEKLQNPQVELQFRSSNVPLEQIQFNLDLSGFLQGSKPSFSMEFESDYLYGDKFSIIRIDGLLKMKSLEPIQRRIDDFTGVSGERSYCGSEGNVNPSGIAQLLIAWKFLEKLHLILSELEDFIDSN
jgi:phosphoribulokinase